MKKYFSIVFLFCAFKVLGMPELNNLMYATFPFEKHEYMVDEKTKKYKEDGRLTAFGYCYISLEKKVIILNELRTKEWSASLNGNTKLELYFEKFKIIKIVKLDKYNYGFEGIREEPFQRKISGKIELKQHNVYVCKVVGFVLKEWGESYDGAMNKFLLLSSIEAIKLKELYNLIYFGDYFAAMGDETIVYE
ncbi:MAG: hypothetical protein ALAOOOJD_02474 [bacterium]|nr:hypothetical protein [bacterium]